MTTRNIVIYIFFLIYIFFNAACKKDKKEDNNDNIVVGPCADIASVTDVESNTYTTVEIGQQCWLKENLKLGTMINGNEIPEDNNIIEKYCFNNDIANCNQYGALYAWNEVMKYTNTEGVQGICPPGFRVPKKSDYQALTAQSGVNGLSIQSTVNEGGATNTTNFSALLAGHRVFSGDFDYQAYKADFWTSTAYSADSYAYSMSIIKAGNAIDQTFFHKTLGFSVRCIKN